MTCTAAVVYLTDAYVFRHEISSYDGVSGDYLPDGTLTVVGCFMAAEPVIGASELTLAPIAGTTTAMAWATGSVTGIYGGTLAHSDLVTALGPIATAGDDAYEVITVGGVIASVTRVQVLAHP